MEETFEAQGTDVKMKRKGYNDVDVILNVFLPCYLVLLILILNLNDIKQGFMMIAQDIKNTILPTAIMTLAILGVYVVAFSVLHWKISRERKKNEEK